MATRGQARPLARRDRSCSLLLALTAGAVAVPPLRCRSLWRLMPPSRPLPLIRRGSASPCTREPRTHCASFRSVAQRGGPASAKRAKVYMLTQRWLCMPQLSTSLFGVSASCKMVKDFSVKAQAISKLSTRAVRARRALASRDAVLVHCLA